MSFFSSRICIPLCFWALSTSVFAIDLQGTVLNEEGKPIGDARVDIATAVPKIGPQVFCPTCYLDCRKFTFTNERGEFRLENLDESLNFTLMVTKAGMKMVHSAQVNPAAGAISVRMKLEQRASDARLVQGLVCDDNSIPVPGVLVTPVNGKNRFGRWTAAVYHIDPVITDKEGLFSIPLRADMLEVRLQFAGEGFCERQSDLLAPGELVHKITLGKGAAIEGKIYSKGTPAPLQPVAVVQMDRSAHRVFIKAVLCFSDLSGSFHFENLPPDEKYVIYTPRGIESTGLVIDSMVCHAPADGQRLQLQNLELKKGKQLSGKLVCAGGIPPGLKLALNRVAPWDVIETDVGADGSFSFPNLPAEPYELGLSSSELVFDHKYGDYHCTSENAIAFKLTNDDITSLTLGIRKLTTDERPLRIVAAPTEWPPGTQLLKGEVVDREGRHLEGLSVFFRATGFSGYVGRHVVTDSSGRFESPMLPDVPITLEVQDSNADDKTSRSLLRSVKRAQLNQTNIKVVFDRELFKPLPTYQDPSARK